jgi:hypothetical protein
MTKTDATTQMGKTETLNGNYTKEKVVFGFLFLVSIASIFRWRIGKQKILIGFSQIIAKCG